MTMTSSSPSEGTFWTGFTVGVVAGAAGYFLFATDRGDKVRRALVDEWEMAKKGMAESGKEAVTGSIRDFLLKAADAFKENFQVAVEQSAKKSPNKITKKSPAKKFKGV